MAMMLMRRTAALAGLAVAGLVGAVQERQISCESSWGGKGESACEIRESTMPASGRLEVNAAPNGGIRIAGWDRSAVLVRAKVQASADTKAEAGQLLKEVRVIAAGIKVESEGPKVSGKSWSVSYEIFVPRKSDLKLRTVNGGINVAEVHGDIEAGTVNGGLRFARSAGRVKGETVNGGITMDLDGSSWQGEGIDLETVNGGVTVSVPASYSARVEAATVHGGLNSDFASSQVEGHRSRKSLNLTLGSGGPLVKLQTVNGGVRVRRAN